MCKSSLNCSVHWVGGGLPPLLYLVGMAGEECYSCYTDIDVSVLIFLNVKGV